MYAVSLVLLPPKDLSESCINLNNKNPDKVILGKLDFQPHLTLSMGILDKRQQIEFCNTITNIAKKYLPLEITATHIDRNWLNIDINNAGSQLQQSCHTILQSYTKERIQPSFFFNPKNELIDESVFRWFLNPNMFSQEKYRPHVTLWTPEKEMNIVLPYTTKWNRLALFHVGNFNTCRKLFWECS